MPKANQIIPKWSVPHVETYINDNSVYEEFTATPSSGTRLLCLLASKKGRDHEVVEIDSLAKYIDEYGEPNYKLYGQAGYMPYAALLSGNAKCFCMRIMPETAKYANVVIVAKIKTEENDEATQTNLHIKYEAMVLSDLTDLDKFHLAVDILTDKSLDFDGYETIPVMAIAMKGRGTYGNSYRFRIVSDTLTDRDNDFKNYVFELLNVESGIKKPEMFSGALYSNAVVGRTSIYLEDVINEPDAGSSKIKTLILEDNINYIYEKYLTEVVPTLDEKAIPITEFDPLLGRTKADKTMNGLIIETEGDNTITFDRVDGIMLSGGDDDTFSHLKSSEERQAAMDAEYIKALKAESGYDKAFRSKRRTPSELILDANFSDSVKRELVALANYRMDARCILDGGILNSTTEIASWADEFYNLGHFIISKECQHYKIKDPFSGKIIPVTTTYFLANNLPRHFAQNGNHIPFYGELYTKLTGHIRNSLTPMIDADDIELKDMLYLKRVNFFECLSENNYARGTQGTSQLVWSDLSEENNVDVLLEMKRMLENFVSAKIYNFMEKEDRIRFTESANAMFEDFKGNKLRTYEVYFDSNKFEEERNILHCYLAVTFKAMAKRGIIEIDINKRTS